MLAAGSAPIVLVGDTFCSMTLPAANEQVRERLQQLSVVKAIEEERIWSIHAVQRDPPVGLDRIDARNGLDQTFTFPDNAGAGVDVFVIDTGITTTHPEFTGRASIIDLTGEGNNDLNGHGTHVAGTIAGSRFGIAKQASVTALKVFTATGSGPNGVILRALQIVSETVRRTGRPSIVNMSLGGPRNPGRNAIQGAIESLTRMGVAVVVSAGNEARDACRTSPAFVPESITVGAVDPRNDQLARFSNVGSCVDLFSPGVRIDSADRIPTNGPRVLSGTSMSAPHVAGVMATYMSQGMNRAQALERLLQTSTRDVVRGNLAGSPNILLFLHQAPPPPPGGGKYKCRRYRPRR
ncbi:peptidase S8/S53 domain-containing protein [Catenaria anguillulae PL171]|uniref:Peptidase S8/S53 domain-containing protein n=1 Tax=Catenaria anguillulae PL171 TaxID=765915 RepID=A0A1Y2HRK5_9FUNG|nr:peptidase S8/S53 domain-containing protein [Catenaria anguillulae PL171]